MSWTLIRQRMGLTSRFSYLTHSGKHLYIKPCELYRTGQFNLVHGFLPGSASSPSKPHSWIESHGLHPSPVESAAICPNTDIVLSCAAKIRPAKSPDCCLDMSDLQRPDKRRAGCERNVAFFMKRICETFLNTKRPRRASAPCGCPAPSRRWAAGCCPLDP